jgi:hypothetical protein
MTLILSADGRTMLDRRTLPMSTDQVTWFLDADAFLQHVPHLWTLDLKVFCLHCWKKKLKDDLRVTYNDLTGVYWVTCQCAKVAGRLPRQGIVRMATDDLLRKLGWSLACTARCAKESGYADGVQADNDPQARTLAIRCGCTIRTHVLATAPAGVVS